jgi:hypothetical protein
LRYKPFIQEQLPPGLRLLILWLCLTSILVSGCALHNAISTPVVEGFVFLNKTPDTIRNVDVKVPDTRETAFCSHIPPGGTCSSTIRARRYQGNSISVNWKQGGKFFAVKKLALGRLNKKFRGESVLALLTFGISGSVSVKLIREGEEWN